MYIIVHTHYTVFVVIGILVAQVSRSQQDQTSLDQELELANDHVSKLEAQHQEAMDKTVELEEKVQYIHCKYFVNVIS